MLKLINLLSSLTLGSYILASTIQDVTKQIFPSLEEAEKVYVFRSVQHTDTVYNTDTVIVYRSKLVPTVQVLTDSIKPLGMVFFANDGQFYQRIEHFNANVNLPDSIPVNLAVIWD